MVVKDKRGRRRYIVFLVRAKYPISKGKLITLMRERFEEAGLEMPRLI
jgi:RNase P/RNase MRP subunit POP5